MPDPCTASRKIWGPPAFEAGMHFTPEHQAGCAPCAGFGGGLLLAWVSPHFHHEPAGREDQQLGSAFSLFPWVKAIVYIGHKKIILWQQTTKEKETSKP